MKDGYKDFKGRNADEIEAYWRKRIPELEADGTPWAHGR